MSVDYHVEDRGILVAPLKRVLWGPMMQWLPLGVSANGMTLLGTGCNLAATVIAITVPLSRPVMAVIALLLFAYFCLDNMDGAQARRTGTQSPLGEFLDHWLDGINAPAIGLCAATCWELSGQWIVVVALSTSTAYTLTHWEHRVTGRLYLGRVGNVEGIAGVLSAYVAQVVLGPRNVARIPVVLRYSATDVVTALVVVACVVITAGAVLRVRRRLVELLLLLAGAAALVAWYFLGDVPFLPVCGLLVLLTPLTGGRMIVARLTAQADMGADHTLQALILLTSATCIALRPSARVQAALCALVLAIALARVLGELVRTVLRLSHHIRPGEFLSHFVSRRPVQ